MAKDLRTRHGIKEGSKDDIFERTWDLRNCGRDMGFQRVQKTTFFKGLGTNKIYVRKDSRVVPVTNTVPFAERIFRLTRDCRVSFLMRPWSGTNTKKGAKHHTDNSFFVTVALM